MRARAADLGVVGYEEPSYFGRTQESWQTVTIEEPAGDDEAAIEMGRACSRGRAVALMAIQIVSTTLE